MTLLAQKLGLLIHEVEAPIVAQAVMPGYHEYAEGL